MRTIIFSIALALLIISGSFAADKVETIKYTVGAKSSSVEWLAKKVTGQHDGTIMVKEGSITTKDDVISGGNFIIDMQSIVILDLKDPGYNQKLVNHLNSEDFFSVKTHPTAELKISKVARMKEKNMVNISGDLTIKGIAHPIKFPASVSIADGKIKASAEITIDRAKYNVRHRSGSFFEGLGDKLIYDDFMLNVTLSATK